jgi:Ca2+-transporting ATPase
VQVRLNSVATMIGKLGLTVAVLVFFILIGKFLYKKNFDFSDWSGKDTLEVVDFFAIAVTIIVVSVPEGLPLAVTLTLAFAMHKMMEQKALVRHLSA